MNFAPRPHHRHDRVEAVGEVGDIDYPNFKDGVRENDRHDAYLQVWSAMHQLQSKRAYPRNEKARKAQQQSLVYDDDYPGDLLEHRDGFPR